MYRFTKCIIMQVQVFRCLYRAPVGVIINNQGRPNTLGLRETAEIEECVNGHWQPMQLVNDAEFATIHRMLLDAYTEHNPEVIQEMHVQAPEYV